jgi:putative ABC transport system ATP-binding protein
VIFADEPTSALDWERGEQIIQLLKRQTREKHCAVVLVTHDHRILDYADRIVTLSDGLVANDRLTG